jgi:serine/threonine protein kinase
MLGPSPLREPLECERNIVATHPLGSKIPTKQWLLQEQREEFTVSDVFSPQATEDGLVDYAVENPNGHNMTAQCENVKIAIDKSATGFRMGPPEVCSTLKDRLSHCAVMNATAGSARLSGNTQGHRSNREKASRKKKKKRRQGADTASATTTPRGFNVLISGDEDSDFSNPGSRAFSPWPSPLVGSGNSPCLRPSTSSAGISALKLQLDTLNLSNSRPVSRATSQLGSQTPSCASTASDSDLTEVMMSYEVPLEHDFVSPDAEVASNLSTGAIDEDQVRSMLHRKMSAADFLPLICLGKGTFGTVLLVKHKLTGRLYAQKQFRKASLTVHKKLVEQTKTERTILESVNRHPFVVKLFYAFQDLEKLYLILEYAQGGELFTHLAMERMFSEDVASFYMAEMVLALEHLHHTVGVIYRDLKPENCLLDAEGHLLLTDFGLSKVAVAEEDRCNSSLGTVEYMAPEVIQGRSYGKACDWWSLGALGFDFLTGSPPFKGNNHAKIQERIIKQKLVLPYFLSPDAKDLLTRLLRKEPHKRLGYHMPKDLQTIKKHRFFRKIDWKALERRELQPPIKPLVTDPALAENFSTDFTELPLSPVATKHAFDNGISLENGIPFGSTRHGELHDPGSAVSEDPFGGFSFVASSSLLESGFGFGSGDPC